MAELDQSYGPIDLNMETRYPRLLQAAELCDYRIVLYNILQAAINMRVTDAHKKSRAPNPEVTHD